MLKDLEFHKHKVLLKSTISRRWSIATLSKNLVNRAALIPEHTNSNSTMKTNFIFKRILNMIWNMRDNLKEWEGIPEWLPVNSLFTLFIYSRMIARQHFIASQLTFLRCFDVFSGGKNYFSGTKIFFSGAKFFFFFFQKTVEKRCKKKHTYNGFCDIEVEHLCCLSPNMMWQIRGNFASKRSRWGINVNKFKKKKLLKSFCLCLSKFKVFVIFMYIWTIVIFLILNVF